MINFLLIQPKAILRKIYPQAICNLSRLDKTIYLTFDDGPIPELTEWVLAELKKYNALATFFCVGANILKYPQIFEKVKSAGHLAANHSMHHIKGFKYSVAEYLKDVDDCEVLTANHLFRPPYGQLKLNQYKVLIEKNYKIVLWDVISYDYEKIKPQKCAANVIRNSRNGSVVLFHDNLKAATNLKYTLPLFLNHFSKLGYTFKTLASTLIQT